MTQQHNLFQKRKGQSAIEYLMTYGWMLLVVAIVGGAIFATVQGQCATQASGFTGESVTVDQFAATDTDLQIVLANSASNQINVTNVSVSSDSGMDTNTTSRVLGVGDTQAFTIDEVSSADACNDFDLDVTFNQGEIDGASASGGLSGNMEFTG